MKMATTLNVISSDLSHQETICQIADALDHLDRITDAIFTRLQAKIDENGAKLSSLDSRVDVASQKVKTLSEMSKKATCVYSSAKYPSENELKDYETAFKDVDHVRFTPGEVKIKRPEKNLKGLDAREMNEKKRYLHLKGKKRPTALQVLEDSPDLRQPSKATTSALSYLIFNTAENPFAKARMADFTNPLDQKIKAKKDDWDANREADNLLGAAPASLGFHDDAIDGTENYFFAPALGDLPDLNLPDILDLPNLPTDLSYITDLGPGIAPSAIYNLPDLPSNFEDSIPDEAAEILAAPPPPPPMAAPPPPIMSTPVLDELPKVQELPKTTGTLDFFYCNQTC
jgi:WAS family protein 1